MKKTCNMTDLRAAKDGAFTGFISSVLSKNEVTRDGPHNRKLFMRIRRGHYIINPTLKLRIDGNWRPIHELPQLDDLAPRLLSPHDFPIHSEQQRRIREQNHQAPSITSFSSLACSTEPPDARHEINPDNGQNIGPRHAPCV